MSQKIFVNLPVTDINRSKAFYEAIGATNNPQFTNDSAAMMSFSEEVNVMLLTHARFADFSPKAIPDARANAQVLLALSRDNRDAVDAMVSDAEKQGATIDPTPKSNYGWLDGRSFEDPDGHIWEVMWMNIAAMPQDNGNALQAASADA